MLKTLAINSNQIMLSFGVLIAFLSPKQSEIKENSLEAMAKMSGQGVRTHHWRTAERGMCQALRMKLQGLLALVNDFHSDNISE